MMSFLKSNGIIAEQTNPSGVHYKVHIELELVANTWLYLYNNIMREIRATGYKLWNKR